jgi:hypothetical protein
VRLVMSGIVQTERQVRIHPFVETPGMYTKRVTVRRVTRAMARIEKSAACTENWPTMPFTMHGVPGCSSPVLRKIMPDTELFKVLMNSEVSCE